MKNAIVPISILGTPEVGETLLIRDNAVVDPDGIIQSSKVYAWFLDGREIKGQISQRLEVTEDMQGQTIGAKLSFTDKAGNTETVKTSERGEKFVDYSDERLKTLSVLYSYLLKRTPDIAGLKFWAEYLEKLENEKTPYALAIVIEAFMSSDSYKDELNGL